MTQADGSECTRCRPARRWPDRQRSAVHACAVQRPGTFEFRSPEVPIVAENGAKALLLDLSMKCSGVSGHNSQSADAINRQGPEQLTNTTTGALPWRASLWYRQAFLARPQFNAHVAARVREIHPLSPVSLGG